MNAFCCREKLGLPPKGSKFVAMAAPMTGPFAGVRAEVEAFIIANNIDESAASALRDCRPDVQQTVLVRGPLVSARNPSAALHGRIRDSRASCSNAVSGAVGGFSGQMEVEAFLLANAGVDEVAAALLRAAAPAVQRQVVARGDLGSAWNPSSALLARLKEVGESAEFTTSSTSGYLMLPAPVAPTVAMLSGCGRGSAGGSISDDRGFSTAGGPVSFGDELPSNSHRRSRRSRSRSSGSASGKKRKRSLSRSRGRGGGKKPRRNRSRSRSRSCGQGKDRRWPRKRSRMPSAVRMNTPAVTRSTLAHSRASHLLSSAPRISFAERLLTANECSRFVAAAERKGLQPGLVEGDHPSSSRRTDSQVVLEPIELMLRPRLLELVQRVQELVGLPLQNMEPLQIARYQRGQRYDFHHDACEGGSRRLSRAVTVIMYLTTAQGGNTLFGLSGNPAGASVGNSALTAPRAGVEAEPYCNLPGLLAVTPRRGDAVVWWNLLPDGTCDELALHAGCPVVAGEKWTSTAWFHTEPFDGWLALLGNPARNPWTLRVWGRPANSAATVALQRYKAAADTAGVRYDLSSLRLTWSDAPLHPHRIGGEAVFDDLRSPGLVEAVVTVPVSAVLTVAAATAVLGKRTLQSSSHCSSRHRAMLVLGLVLLSGRSNGNSLLSAYIDLLPTAMHAPACWDSSARIAERYAGTWVAHELAGRRMCVRRFFERIRVPEAQPSENLARICWAMATVADRAVWVDGSPALVLCDFFWPRLRAWTISDDGAVFTAHIPVSRGDHAMVSQEDSKHSAASFVDHAFVPDRCPHDSAFADPAEVLGSHLGASASLRVARRQALAVMGLLDGHGLVRIGPDVRSLKLLVRIAAAPHAAALTRGRLTGGGRGQKRRPRLPRATRVHWRRMLARRLSPPPGAQWPETALRRVAGLDTRLLRCAALRRAEVRVWQWAVAVVDSMVRRRCSWPASPRRATDGLAANTSGNIK